MPSNAPASKPSSSSSSPDAAMAIGLSDRLSQSGMLSVDMHERAVQSHTTRSCPSTTTGATCFQSAYKPPPPYRGDKGKAAGGKAADAIPPPYM